MCSHTRFSAGHLSHFVVVKVRADAGHEVGQGDVQSTGRRDDHVTGGSRPSCRPRLGHERQSTACVVGGIAHSHDERKSILTECSEQDARLLAGLAHWRQVTGQLHVLWLSIQHLHSQSPMYKVKEVPCSI